MGEGEVDVSELFLPHEGDAKCIAHGEHSGCGGGGCEVEWAGFLLYGDIEGDIGFFCKVGTFVARNGYDSYPDAPERRDDEVELFGHAAFGEADDDVTRLYYSQVAMCCFCRVHKESCGAGGGEGCCYFLADNAGFAHSRDDDLAFAFFEQGDSALKFSSQVGRDVFQGPGFHSEYAATLFDDAFNGVW
ncbi:hypothetical protein Ptc2401_00423 [Prosthecochloris sp. CIB 2401]|nr:hypothetical protein Ptc2401_00423 [Prosthecochloris sp. CIB 2401]